MSDEQKNEGRDQMRTGLCGCKKCRGGARPGEHELAGSEAVRLLDEAIKSMPERLSTPQDRRTWAGMVLGGALATIERENVDALIETGEDPTMAMVMVLSQVTEAMGKDLALHLHNKDPAFVPPQLALVKMPSLADILRSAAADDDDRPDSANDTRKLH